MQKDRVWHLVSKKLAGEATAAELTELEELLRQHPEMHYAIQHVQDLWKFTPCPPPKQKTHSRNTSVRCSAKASTSSGFKPTASTDTFQASQQPDAPKRHRLGKRIALAAAVFAAIFTGIFIFLDRAQPAPAKQETANLSEISTRNGSRSRINLPDGSVVWLNAGSKLVYDKNFDSHLREVTLTGEAYFDVVKNPSKPFIIHAGKMDIKVLGTLFNVKSYPNEELTEASLIRGSIEVTIRDQPSKKIILKPNEKIIVSNEPASVNDKASPAERNDPVVAITHLSYEPKDSTIIETSWVENKLIFMDESFKDMAVKLERWYGVLIRFDNEQVQQMRFTGSFIRNESIHQAMAALKITGNFNYTINENIVRIY